MKEERVDGRQRKVLVESVDKAAPPAFVLADAVNGRGKAAAVA
jgi:hypothetical protein